MKKFISIIALLTGFAIQAATSDYQCVPTKSVEQARADYEYGIQLLDANLRAEYSAATTDLDHAYDMNMYHYEHKLSYLKHEHREEIAAIKRELAPGWRQAVQEATARYNNNVLAARDEYNAQNDHAVHCYNESNARSRAHYYRQAQSLADEHNRAVCANTIVL